MSSEYQQQERQQILGYSSSGDSGDPYGKDRRLELENKESRVVPRLDKHTGLYGFVKETDYTEVWVIKPKYFSVSKPTFGFYFCKYKDADGKVITDFVDLNGRVFSSEEDKNNIFEYIDAMDKVDKSNKFDANNASKNINNEDIIDKDDIRLGLLKNLSDKLNYNNNRKY